jgi:hypothetical protein
MKQKLMLLGESRFKSYRTLALEDYIRKGHNKRQTPHGLMRVFHFIVRPLSQTNTVLVVSVRKKTLLVTANEPVKEPLTFTIYVTGI